MQKAKLLLFWLVALPSGNSLVGRLRTNRVVSNHIEDSPELPTLRYINNEYGVISCNGGSGPSTMSKPKSNPLNSLSLHEAVSSTLKRQHILGAVPPAMRFIPLGAFAAKELYERQMGKMEALQGQDEQIYRIEIAAGSIENTPNSRLWSCALCHPTHPRSNQVAMKSMFIPSILVAGSRQKALAFEPEVGICTAQSPESRNG